MAKKRHLKGWEWYKSDRAVRKKNRAKFGSTSQTRSGNFSKADFIERGRSSSKFGIISTVSINCAEVYIRNKFKPCLIHSSIKIPLVAGDHVIITRNCNGDLEIIGVLERLSVLRKNKYDNTRSLNNVKRQILAANMDVMIIVSSVDKPRFSTGIIDRYLILAKSNNLTPILCVNKCDLTGKTPITLAPYKSLRIPIVKISTVTNIGIDELKTLIKDKTAILVGNSGTGKTSIINSISHEGLQVGKVSQKSGTGRHTTTTSRLIVWDQDSYIIDTPGIRTLQITEMDPEEVQLYFDDILSISRFCKYKDCLHVNENQEGCAVLKAVDDGILSKARYSSYRKIVLEI